MFRFTFSAIVVAKEQACENNKAAFRFLLGRTKSHRMLIAWDLHQESTSIRSFVTEKFRHLGRLLNVRQNMSDARSVLPLSGVLRFVHWPLSLLVALFYLLSMAGWFKAMGMAYSGELGESAKSFVSESSVLEHLMRGVQVVVVSVASVLLVALRRMALTAFLTVLGISLIATLVIGSWSVSYLGGIIGVPLLAICSAYCYWLQRIGVMR